jgi:hypothetical protein
MKQSLALLVCFLACFSLVEKHVVGNAIGFPNKSCSNAVANGNFALCATELAKSIRQLDDWGGNEPIKRCGIPCTVNSKGRLSKWEWKWDARFRCNSRVPGIIGEATQKSRNGSVEWAMKDFFGKAKAAGYIKAEEESCWEANW